MRVPVQAAIAVFAVCTIAAVPPPTVTRANWGRVVAPTWGTHAPGVYHRAEQLAGPGQFDGDYFHGVLPNGRLVRPIGRCVQVGMNPLGIAVTPDGRYVVTSNDDEREDDQESVRFAGRRGGYSLSVVDTRTMRVVSTAVVGDLFIGLAITGRGPYTVWASGGGINAVRVLRMSARGTIAADAQSKVVIAPHTSAVDGEVSHYRPGAAVAGGDRKPPVPAPSGFDRRSGAASTFPAGMRLSPDGRWLYVACDGDGSVAVIDTASRRVVRQVHCGPFPYDVAVTPDGRSVYVTDWGVLTYRFAQPKFAHGELASIGRLGNTPSFEVPNQSTDGGSSVTVLDAPGGDGRRLAARTTVSVGHALDPERYVGGSHPCATAVVGGGAGAVLYVALANDDRLAVIRLATGRLIRYVDMSLVRANAGDGHRIVGGYPNAIAVAPRRRRAYVAEAGTNCIDVLDTTDPAAPTIVGRIAAGWYPSAVAMSPDGNRLYVANAKGIGEDTNPRTRALPGDHPTGNESFEDSNLVFGTLQAVDLAMAPGPVSVARTNYRVRGSADTSVVPDGGAPSQRIRHVVFILQENKTFDSMLGTLTDNFGPFASTHFNGRDGSPQRDEQYTGVDPNTRLLASTFCTAVNYYSDSEESDAGHNFCISGTASDFTEKTLLVKDHRGLLVNKNQDPEDWPESGYIFNNAARNRVAFKDYGEFVRTTGTDTGGSVPTVLNDPASGRPGYPLTAPGRAQLPDSPANRGDVTSPLRGLGQSYFLSVPALGILGTDNPGGGPRIDRNYAGYNFNISDQRRALEFARDFDRMVRAGKVPALIVIYLPNDHTGGHTGASPAEQVADGDVALGMVVKHIMKSPIWYDRKTNTGAAIFMTYDDAQSTLDHVHQHRTPLILASPFARRHAVAYRHYSSASIVKTEELLLGLPPNNLGDLMATDLREMFQPAWNRVTADTVRFVRPAAYQSTAAGRGIWALSRSVDTSQPDRDSRRLGELARLSMAADRAVRAGRSPRRLSAEARAVARGGSGGDGN